MRDEMEGADTNADAEAALDKIKGDIANAKTNGGDAAAIHDEVNAALKEYGSNADVVAVLQPIADKLNSQYTTSNPVNGAAAPGAMSTTVAQTNNGWPTWGVSPHVAPSANSGHLPQAAAAALAPTVKITDDEVDAWTKNIGDTLDNLGKTDQLSLIDIQEVNSELNQAKQTASALMDAADKSATAIIEHIS
jgi:hypothetical protein